MKVRHIFLPVLLAGALASCEKAGTQLPGGEIVIAVEDEELGAAVDTKAVSAVSSIPSTLYWGATTGSGTETTKWSSASAAVSDGRIATGRYQSETPTAYNYYVSNVAMSVGANTSVSATGGTSGTDVVCGRTAASTLTGPTVSLNHIFARTGTITTTCTNGSLSSISYTIKTKGSNTGTSGTYNLRTGAWSSTSGLTSATAITTSSDMYVIPGQYTISVTATYTRGDYVVTKTTSGDMTLTGGKINNITLTWPDAGTEIKITVKLTEWTNTSVSPEMNVCPAVDLGNHSGGTAVLYAAWNVGASSPTDYGDYFAWGETNKRYTSIAGSTITGATFEWSNAPYHTGSSYSTGWTKYIPSSKTSYWSGSGSPDDKLTLDLMDDAARVQWGGDWRTPTEDELYWLVDNCTWTWQSDYNSSGISGFLVTGAGSYSSASVFFPAAGHCSGSSRDAAGEYGYYWSSSVYSDYPFVVSHLNFLGYPENESYGYSVDPYERLSGFSVRPVRTVSL